MLPATIALFTCFVQYPPFLAEEHRVVEEVKRHGGELRWVGSFEEPQLSLDFNRKVLNYDLSLISKLNRLYALRFLQGDVKESTLKELRGLKNLRLLVLHGKGVSDSGLRFVGELTQLEKLDIKGDLISKAGILNLQKLTHLKYLYLYGTKIKDVDIEPFYKMTWLEVLDLPSSISEKFVLKLRKVLSKTEINRI